MEESENVGNVVMAVTDEYRLHWAFFRLISLALDCRVCVCVDGGNPG